MQKKKKKKKENIDFTSVKTGKIPLSNGNRSSFNVIKMSHVGEAMAQFLSFMNG